MRRGTPDDRRREIRRASWVVPRRVRSRTAVSAVLIVACAALSGCGGRQSTLAPASKASHDIAKLWWWMLLIACVVFAGALSLLAIAFLRRRREGLPVVDGSARLNLRLVVVFGIVIPASVNIALFVVADFFLIKETQAPAESTTPLTIHVVGRQWFWEVRYPGSAAVTANEIHIPARTRVNLVATTGDVIHSFWVPQLNRKIDMIPGRRNRVLLYADKPGRYRGQCAEFCGAEHARMAMYVDAQTPEDFARWLRAEAADAQPPTTPAARRGRQAFMNDQCASCHMIRGTKAGGQVGPDLTHVGSRSTLAALTLPNTPAALARWLRDPQHIKPGNRMPDLGLSESDIRDLGIYLEGLR